MVSSWRFQRRWKRKLRKTPQKETFLIRRMSKKAGNYAAEDQQCYRKPSTDYQS